MKDKDIRKILISYLKATQGEIRIFQEKSIGNSVCDIMMVSDRLTGFEIKSDADNYTRLKSQTAAYNKFFDECYIVVSKSHEQSVTEKVPDFWGIITVYEDDIAVVRTAKPNKSVSRRSQLSILWKLELKNLLVKNRLPAFAQKEKGYISDQIAKLVSPKKLGEQIANELMRRDYSVYGAVDYTIFSVNENERLPVLEIVDNLSEMNLSTNMTLDKWINIYKNAVALRDEKETVYKRKPIVYTPHAIPYTDIEVSLGVPWVSKEIVEDFCKYLFDTRVNICYEEITGAWQINSKNSSAYTSNYKITNAYGLDRYNALWIIEATLNLRQIRLFDSGTKYNEEETLVAIEKQRLINSEFKKWVWTDDDRKWFIEDAYNKIFGKYEKKAYDGKGLTFPKMSESYTLYPYQLDAVQKIISTKNTLLAFDVGAGKTYIMIASAMKMRQDGISRKNMFVVPNNIVGQWEKIFSELYPSARLLVVEPKTFKPEMRKKVLEQIKNGDYDGIIIAYSCFELIPLSSDYIISEMKKQTDEIQNAIANVRYNVGKNSLLRFREYIEKLAYRLIESTKANETPNITFDKLEINSIFLDEAHNYKNIPIRTALKDLNGINTTGSKKCLDMQNKIRCVQEANGGRGAILATGTPLCNSISDAYALQMYLQREDMERTHLNIFDNWVKTFAHPEQLCEIDVDTSNFRFVTRFIKFFNLPELSKMIGEVAIFHAVSDDELPDFSGYTDIKIKKNAALSNYMKRLSERTDKIRSKEVDKYTDNMLKISTDGRKAALDLTLVGEKQIYDNTSKIVRCIKNVKNIYDKYSGCSQLIFCDYSTPKRDCFDVYNELKSRLIKAGINENEIAFIHSYKSESTKLKLFADVNSGKIRVLIGSTFKLGIGANVQTRLKAIHHLDVPWRPADMVQREGRILRRGNENNSVEIYRYIAKGSFDAYAWQILENKQRFISQFLSGSTYQRSASDLENSVLTYAEVKALAIAVPLMKQIAEKENECNKYKILALKEREKKKKLTLEYEEYEDRLVIAKRRYYAAQEILQKISFIKASYFSDKKELLTKQKIAEGNGAFLFSTHQFEFSLPKKQEEKNPCIIIKPLSSMTAYETEYRLETGGSPSGNIKRIANFINHFDKTVKAENNTLTDIQSRLEQLKQQLGTQPKYDSLYREAKEELDSLKSLAAAQAQAREEQYA